ncbi:Non-hemolytic phospholipase C [Triticum urartu]|uniref:Non-hemolytic phospholipase C n=1 Tax=Triticum urartu TaxID=4572 RepID=M7ZIH9_TRIUA|nr:Non-hemolytic phospholipase C [Triticum urartu]
MSGFVRQARSIGGGNMTDAVMNGFAPDSVAVYRELVAQFAVCDRWFASVPSSTQPNRLFVHSGTSGGATSNNPEARAALIRVLFLFLGWAAKPSTRWEKSFSLTLQCLIGRCARSIMHPCETDATWQYPRDIYAVARLAEPWDQKVDWAHRRLLAKGYPQRTIFDNVHDAGLSFGIYFQDVPAVLFYRNLRKLKYILNFHPFHNAFRDHASRGSLPNYAVIEQHYMDSKDHPANDDHPSHDVYQGQMFVKEIYETLRASPQWNETLMVLTYDEHGGFFDHVPTPVDGVPSPDDIVGPPPYNFTFNRLGVRVPAILISPWIDKGTVMHGPNGSPTPTSQFEHSSIPATVKKLFNLPQDFLTKRDAWAGTFEGVVQTRTEPRTDCPEQLPTPTRIRQTEANEEAKLSSFQQEIVQLAAVLNGDHQLSSLQERIRERMNVREGTSYMRSAVRRFFEAGMSAKRMGLADDEQIVKMRPSLTTRMTSSPADQDDSP